MLNREQQLCSHLFHDPSTHLLNSFLFIRSSTMSQSYEQFYHQACEFAVPIRLTVPMFLEPKVFIQAPECVRETVQVYLEPEIYLEPEVSAAPPVCIPQGCEMESLPASAD
jgi:hypothetical protein